MAEPINIQMLMYSKWQCYLFGTKPGESHAFIFQPLEGQEPNWFIRWMMKVCLGCTWVKVKINNRK